MLDADRLIDVLERGLLAIRELQIELSGNLRAHMIRETDAAGSSLGFEPGSNADRDLQDIIFVDGDIAQVDPDAVVDPPAFSGVPGGHGPLDLNSGRHRVHGTRKLGEQPVTHQLHYSAVMLGDRRSEDLNPMFLEGPERAVLVHPNQMRVTDNIGHEDGNKLVLNGRPLDHSSGYQLHLG